MRVGFYGDQVVPRIIDIACGAKRTEPLRRRVCAGLAGQVFEIGFGSGLNVPYYPPAVTRVDAVEPAEVGWRLARKRRTESPTPVRRVGLDGQCLRLDDRSYDAAVSTWWLCTIHDPVTALREVRRVLKPGATLHFVEHGLAPDARVQRWQRRLEPVQKRVAGGCHLSRPIEALLTAAGFRVVELDVFYEARAPKILGALSLGVAIPR